jgi:hypothetical protein
MGKRTKEEREATEAAKAKRLGEHARVEQLTLKVTSHLLADIDALRSLHTQRRTRVGAANTVSAVARDALEIGLRLMWIEASYPEMLAEVAAFRQRLAIADIVGHERAKGLQMEGVMGRLPPFDDDDAQLVRDVLGEET